MAPERKWIWCLAALFTLGLHAGELAASEDPQPDWKQSLFSASDPIAQLWPNNFTSTVHKSHQLWFVMFYVAWCGHCRRAAPIYSLFSQQIRDWSPVVKLGAVTCSDLANQKLCRSYGVEGYPTFKLFPPNSDPSFKGTPATAGRNDDVTHNLRDVLLQFINQLVLSGNTDPSWPPLNYVNSARELQTRDSNFTFIVVEDTKLSDRNIGLAVMLDLLSARPKVIVGRMTIQRARVSSPGLYVYTKGRLLFPVTSLLSEEAMVTSINRYSALTPQVSSTVGDYVTTIAPVTPARNLDDLIRPKGLHMKDLESSLYRSLWMEVAAHSSISGDQLSALKKYVYLLAQYHPSEEHVKNFLTKLNDWLQSTSDPMAVSIWSQKLDEFQSRNAFIPENETYTGCAGSSPQFRGYTCSLWMTFHALTVSAYQAHSSDPRFHPLTILNIIADYIKYFFGCRECADHFAQMARTMPDEVSSVRDLVLWLWRAHNRVNLRLHGDVATEDPYAPKIQFPPQIACPSCVDERLGKDPFSIPDDAWQLDHVMDYLTRYYSKRSVIDDHDESTQNIQSDASSPSLQHSQRSVSCVLVSTDWTTCSRSCDVGVSTRMINSESDCRLQIETRLCMLRPCTIQFTDWTRSPWHIDNCPKVAHTYRLIKPQALSYGNCTTVDSRLWRVCGRCPRTRQGRTICCRPARSTTSLMDVVCTTRAAVDSRVMVTATQLLVEDIEYCECNDNCFDYQP